MKRPSRRRNESGAVAIMSALLAVVMLGAAALGVDLASQVNERQKLQDAMDAGATAGAYQLPTNGAQASIDATAFARSADAGETPASALRAEDLLHSVRPDVGGQLQHHPGQRQQGGPVPVRQHARGPQWQHRR